jgi:protein ImuA
MKQATIPSSCEKLARLRQELGGRLKGINQRGTPTIRQTSCSATLTLGLPTIDAYLGGGLARGAVHEIAGAGCDTELATAPAFFASQLIRHHDALRAIWIAGAPDLYGPGLHAMDIDPARLLLVESRQDAESLWALEEAARSGAAPLVIGEIDLLDLTASRRLQLAAEDKNCTMLLLRRSRLMGKSDKHRQPSAATTRWLITPRPSQPTIDAAHPDQIRPGLGSPCWHLHLWRQRNGPPAAWNITLQDRCWRQITPEPQRQAIMAANDDSHSVTYRQHSSSAV